MGTGCQQSGIQAVDARAADDGAGVDALGAGDGHDTLLEEGWVAAIGQLRELPAGEGPLHARGGVAAKAEARDHGGADLHIQMRWSALGHVTGVSQGMQEHGECRL